MNDNNNRGMEPLKPGDARVIRNKHNELDALLAFICQDELQPFLNLSGGQQKSLLILARSASQSLADCLEHI